MCVKVTARNGGADFFGRYASPVRRYAAVSVWSRASHCALDRQAAIWKNFLLAAVGSACYRTCASSGGGDIAADPAAARPVLLSMRQGPWIIPKRTNVPLDI